MRKVIKILGILVLVVFLSMVALYLYADNAPVIHQGYNQKIKTGGDIEHKYLQSGNFTTKKTTAKAEKPLKKYTIYHPEELENTKRVYPMILVVNGTGFKATKYKPELERMASWGFIVVGTQDKGTGTGKTTITTLNYMLAQNEDPNSVFYHKIDADNIGITGFSQGGAATIRAFTMYDESHYFKTAVPLSPVSERTAEQSTDYPYDSAKITRPILMLAGTVGDFETKIVIPITEMNRMYDKIHASKVMARRVGMDHDQMMYSAGGYVTAWFMWQLQGDQEASKAFSGANPELLSNPLYLDQKIDLISEE